MWVYARLEFRCQDSKTRLYHVTILQIPDHTISKDSALYLKRSVLRCFWLLQSLFCWKRFCPGVFAFIRIIYIYESKLLKTVFWTYGNIYIMRQFKWGVIAILLYFLSNGMGGGECDKRSFLNRKCRTLEYLLNARLNTLTSFGELVETREKVLHCFCKVYFSKIHTCLERNKYRLLSKHFYGSRTLTL